MAKVNDITVEVKANITVDKTTAEACLKLVELYINQNNVDIIGNTKEDGTIEIKFQKGDIVTCKECIYDNCGMCSHVDHEWEKHEADYFCADGERCNDGK